jgi:putative ABC transport system substrate-binding protein
MKRREFITLLGGAAAAPVAARGQQGKIWRIGTLETTSLALNSTNFAALQDALRTLGYVEGRNLIIIYRSAEGRNERFPQLAAELLDMKIDLILTRGTPATIAARNADGTIPIVMTSTANPYAVVGNIARPSGNVTGLASLLVDSLSKRIELIAEIVPNLARFGSLVNPDNPTFVRSRMEIEAASRSLGIEFVLLNVRTSDDLDAAFVTASNQQIGALTVATETVTQANRKLIVDLAAKHRIPAIYGSREFVEAGGLIAYGVSYPDLYRRAAIYIDRIFKGAKPADLPIEQPTRFYLVVNLKAAKGIGLTIPEKFLVRADEVIE